MIEATTKVGIVMLAAGTIAALSFGSLATFGLPTIKNFGLCTAFGIVAALTVEMTFIPAIRVLMSPPSERQTEREKREEYFDPILEKLAATIRAGRERPIVWGFCGILVLALIRGDAARGGQQPERPVLRGQCPRARLPVGRRSPGRNARHPGAGRGESPDAIKNPDVLRRMDALGTFIAHQPLPIGKVVSIVDLLKQLSVVVDPAGGGKLPDSEQGSRNICCSTAWAATRKTWPAWLTARSRTRSSPPTSRRTINIKTPSGVATKKFIKE